VRDITNPQVLRETILRNQANISRQEPEEMFIQPQNERVAQQKRLDQRSKAVANRLLVDLGVSRTGREIGKHFQGTRGKANSQAIIILMQIEINHFIGISGGQRGEIPLENLRRAYDQIDAIGDALVAKIRTSFAVKKG